MTENEKSQRDSLLAKVGLQKKMRWKSPQPSIFDSSIFDSYRSEEYKNSSRIDPDEVYYMRERVLIHKVSGMRIEILEKGNYMDDESEVDVLNIFIFTSDHKKFCITDIDFSKLNFTTPEGAIDFSMVKKDSLGDWKPN